MVHRRNGGVRRLVLNRQQLHLLPSHPGPVLGARRLGRQDQPHHHLLHGGGIGRAHISR